MPHTYYLRDMPRPPLGPREVVCLGINHVTLTDIARMKALIPRAEAGITWVGASKAVYSTPGMPYKFVGTDFTKSLLGSLSKNTEGVLLDYAWLEVGCYKGFYGDNWLDKANAAFSHPELAKLQYIVIPAEGLANRGGEGKGCASYVKRLWEDVQWDPNLLTRGITVSTISAEKSKRIHPLVLASAWLASDPHEMEKLHNFTKDDDKILNSFKNYVAKGANAHLAFLVFHRGPSFKLPKVQVPNTDALPALLYGGALHDHLPPRSVTAKSPTVARKPAAKSPVSKSPQRVRNAVAGHPVLANSSVGRASLAEREPSPKRKRAAASPSPSPTRSRRRKSPAPNPSRSPARDATIPLRTLPRETRLFRGLRSKTRWGFFYTLNAHVARIYGDNVGWAEFSNRSALRLIDFSAPGAFAAVESVLRERKDTLALQAFRVFTGYGLSELPGRGHYDVDCEYADKPTDEIQICTEGFLTAADARAGMFVGLRFHAAMCDLGFDGSYVPTGFLRARDEPSMFHGEVVVCTPLKLDLVSFHETAGEEPQT